MRLVEAASAAEAARLVARVARHAPAPVRPPWVDVVGDGWLYTGGTLWTDLGGIAVQQHVRIAPSTAAVLTWQAGRLAVLVLEDDDVEPPALATGRCA